MSSAVFAKNSRSPTGINYICYYDASAGTWSNNLLNYSPPYFLLPAGATNNDALYFCADTTLVGMRRFMNVVMNIRAGAGYMGQWEFYNGVAFVAFGAIALGYPFDYTDQLLTSGINPVVVSAYDATPSWWQTVNLFTLLGGSAPNITGYWIRFRVTGGVATSLPAALDFHPYFASNSHIDYDGNSAGDIAATVKHLAQAYMANTVVASAFLMGVRTLARGENFESVIQISDQENKLGISITAVVGGFIVWSTPEITGEIDLDTTYRYVAPAAGYTDRELVRITIPATVAKEYYGRFRTFIVGGGSDAVFQVRVAVGNIANFVYYSDKINSYPSSSSTRVSKGLGDIVIPRPDEAEDSIVYISIFASSYAGGGDVYLNRLVLIPADECVVGGEAVQNKDGLASSYIYPEDWAFIDGLSSPKSGSYVFDVLNEDRLSVSDTFSLSTNSTPVIPADSAARIWIISQGLTGMVAFSPAVYRIETYLASRYLGMRGDR